MSVVRLTVPSVWMVLVVLRASAVRALRPQEAGPSSYPIRARASPSGRSYRVVTAFTLVASCSTLLGCLRMWMLLVTSARRAVPRSRVPCVTAIIAVSPLTSLATRSGVTGDEPRRLHSSDAMSRSAHSCLHRLHALRHLRLRQATCSVSTSARCVIPAPTSRAPPILLLRLGR